MGRAAETFCAAALLWSASAQAQESPLEASAQQLFEEGSNALGEGRFTEAARLFREVLAQRPHLGAAFNLAVALRGTGEMTRALEVLRALLDGRYGALGDAQRDEAEAIAEDVRASLVVISIVVSGAREARILVDGAPAGRVEEARPLRLRLDPGDHVLGAIATDGRQAAVRGRWDAHAAPPPEIRLRLAPPARRARSRREPRRPSAWPWVLGIGIPVVVTAATAAVVLLAAPAPDHDFLGRRVEVP